jgi:ABC-2 type transport system permease protein
MIFLLVGKDLRVLRRSRALVAALVLYPLLLAALLALVAREAGSLPRIAYVDESGLPGVLQVNSAHVDYGALLDQIRQRAELVPMSAAEADRALADGSVVAEVRIPHDFVDELKSTVSSPAIEVKVRGGAVGERALREIQAFVFELNGQVQQELVAQAIRFLSTVVNGGKAELAGNELNLLGLQGAATIVNDELAQVTDPARREQLQRVRDFANATKLGLAFAAPSLKTVAAPVQIRSQVIGSDDPFGSRGIGIVLAVGLVLACSVLGATMLAAERAERTLGRLVHAKVGLGRLIMAKLVVGGLAGALLATLVVAAYAVLVRIAGGPGLPAGRLVLLLPLAVTGGVAAAAAGALVATLARDEAASALGAVLLALPFVLVGVAPHATGALHAVTGAFPFSPLADAVAGALYDPSWGSAVLSGCIHLGLLAAILGGAARLAAPRLTT